jgi:hypothetical protein
MPDDARDAAEEESAFSHPPVDPDITAAYGDHPDQVVDFYAPRGGEERAPLVVVLHGGAWRAPYDRRHITPFADFLARRGFAVANVEYRRGGTIPAQGGSGPGRGTLAGHVRRRGGGARRDAGTRARGPAAGRPAPHGGHRALGGRPAGSLGGGPPPAAGRRTVAHGPPRPAARRRRTRPDRRLHGRGETGRLLRRDPPTPGRGGEVRRTPSRTPTRPCSSRRASPRPWSRAARTPSYRRRSPRHTRTRRPRPARW